MTPDLLERVYEPFFTTKPVGKGTGLGLSQVFGLMQQLCGGVAIASRPGEGTAVTLYVPRRHAPAADATEDRPSEEHRAGIVDRSLGILVVEDDPRVLAATMGAIEELGHRGVACGDPLAAPALLEGDGAIDLVVSDVLMPGQNGPEMVAGLLARRPDLAVLYVTGYAGDAADGAAFGDHDVLRKPFTLAALERAVAAAATRRPGSAPMILPPAAVPLAAE